MPSVDEIVAPVVRKYAFQRIVPGLVVQPANDGETMFAVARYVDGPSWGLEDEPRDFVAWAWGRISPERFARIQARAQHDPEGAVDELREWAWDNRWPRHATMKAAIEDALASVDRGGAR